MQIRSVTAHAFGPLHGETLDLAEGMTVVVGDNESAKSSWHAAIYAALCGRRRGKGRSRLDEQRFADLHRPWDGDGWLVSARLELDDGRRVEMRHDLAGKVDCHAKDLVLGRDISAEVMNDGTPDGSRWLGLDRDSFVATACVEQAQLLLVLDDADGLQEHLQRAAATAGTDATAAAALDCIEEFAREHVGLERVNSTKPLQRALNGCGRTEEDLRRCRSAHEEYLARVENVDELREQAAGRAAAVRAHEAGVAAVVAAQLATQIHRAAQLHAIYGDTAPTSVADDDALARQVSAAMASWQARTEETSVPQRSSTQVQADIDALPPAPEGDVEAHPSVVKALAEFTRADAQLDQHARSHPSAEVHVPQVAAGDDELLDLARELELPSLSTPPLRPSVAVGRHTAARGSDGSVGLVVGGGAALAVLGGVAFAVSVFVGAILLVAGLVIVAVGLLRRRGAGGGSAAESATTQAQAQAVWRREQAVARCAHLGIAPDPAALRAVPVARSQAVGLANHLAQWTGQDAELRAKASAGCAELAGALSARGLDPDGADRRAVLAAADQYQRECRHHAAQAAAAARRQDLSAQLSAVQSAEARAAHDEQERARAIHDLLTAAQACGISAETPDQAAGALKEWVQQREARLGEVSVVEREWAELAALLAGRTLADLEQAASSARDEAQRLATGVDPAVLASVDAATATDRLPALREDVAEAETLAASAAGELRLFASSIGSVAEAEEAAEQAAAELVRVRELADTLALTRSFLAEAQTRVHRDIAPVLAAAVKRDLPKLTEGRYIDVIVDPTTLQVQVCGPSRRWRDAGRLSYGTAEQVYLLLRVALADHLTKSHDTCPLLFDDVTVHADSTRTRNILDLLLQVAETRQVVLFTQEEQVAAWARESLQSERHAIRELQPVPAR
jgi:exonuclease SbcC